MWSCVYVCKRFYCPVYPLQLPMLLVVFSITSRNPRKVPTWYPDTRTQGVTDTHFYFSIVWINGGNQNGTK